MRWAIFGFAATRSLTAFGLGSNIQPAGLPDGCVVQSQVYTLQAEDNLSTMLYQHGVGLKQGVFSLYGLEGWVAYNQKKNPVVKNWRKILPGQQIRLYFPQCGASTEVNKAGRPPAKWLPPETPVAPPSAKWIPPKAPAPVPPASVPPAAAPPAVVPPIAAPPAAAPPVATPPVATPPVATPPVTPPPIAVAPAETPPPAATPAEPPPSVAETSPPPPEEASPPAKPRQKQKPGKRRKKSQPKAKAKPAAKQALPSYAAVAYNYPLRHDALLLPASRLIQATLKSREAPLDGLCVFLDTVPRVDETFDDENYHLQWDRLVAGWSFGLNVSWLRLDAIPKLGYWHFASKFPVKGDTGELGPHDYTFARKFSAGIEVGAEAAFSWASVRASFARDSTALQIGSREDGNANSQRIGLEARILGPEFSPHVRSLVTASYINEGMFLSDGPGKTSKVLEKNAVGGPGEKKSVFYAVDYIGLGLGIAW